MAKIKLDGVEVNTAGELPQPGSLAPDFTLVKSDLTEATLEDFKGCKLILNIFPSVGTNVCAISVRRFNQMVSSLANVKVLCISQDLPFEHYRFCGSEEIRQVITLSNFRDGGNFALKYGVLLKDGLFKGLNARAIVTVDENGKVIYTQLVDDIGNEPDYEAAIASLNHPDPALSLGTGD
ncbi:MAG: thiol peroxidase [Cyclobacteriaceae bacterium]|nr:thiol peroxidase [Cyclobacteriaceae bacterium]